MKSPFLRLAAICALAGSVFVYGGMDRSIQAQRAGAAPAGVPKFEVDPSWQRYLSVGDYGNGHVHILDRKALRVMGKFGEMSGKPGDFRGLHALDVDSKGNLWTAETQPRPAGSRVQRFILKGLL